MADNTVQNGTDTISTDDLGGGVKVQRVKVQHGGDGVATDVTTLNGLPVQSMQPAISTTNWTSGTAGNAANTVTVTGLSTVSVGLHLTSTMTAGVITFEVSPDNTNWFPIMMNRVEAYTTEATYTLVFASGDRGWSVSVDAWNYFRVRLSTVITGSGTASVFISAASEAVEPSVTVGQSSAASLLATVTQGALTKGAQNATGVSTQDLHNSGRNLTNYFMAAPIITTVAEVMMSLTGYKSGAVVGATATPAVVTAGKTYRIERVIITYIAATAIGSMRVNLRALSSGVAVIGSPLVQSWQVGIPAIFTAGSAETYVFDYPEGLEFAAGFGIAVSIQGFGAVPTTGTIVGYGMIAIEGYEY